jgi:hypothetical protein
VDGREVWRTAYAPDDSPHRLEHLQLPDPKQTDCFWAGFRDKIQLIRGSTGEVILEQAYKTKHWNESKFSIWNKLHDGTVRVGLFTEEGRTLFLDELRLTLTSTRH